jgi:hypothetical protein
MPGTVLFDIRRWSEFGKNRKAFCTKSRKDAEWEIPEEVTGKSLIIHDSHWEFPRIPMADWTVGANGRSFFLENKEAKMP